VIVFGMICMMLSCSKEKRYQSKVIGDWDIYQVIYSTNYYELDSVVIDNTIDNYGEITFTKMKHQQPTKLWMWLMRGV